MQRAIRVVLAVSLEKAFVAVAVRIVQNSRTHTLILAPRAQELTRWPFILALAVHLTKLELASVHRAIGPDLLSLALTDVTSREPLSFVFGMVVQKLHRMHFEMAVQIMRNRIIVVERAEFFADCLLEIIQNVTYGDARIIIIDNAAWHAKFT